MEFSGVFGNMCGVLFAAFLAYFLGFVGPFAFCGSIFLFYAIFQNTLVKFIQIEDDKEGKRIKGNNSFYSLV